MSIDNGDRPVRSPLLVTVDAAVKVGDKTVGRILSARVSAPGIIEVTCEIDDVDVADSLAPTGHYSIFDE